MQRPSALSCVLCSIYSDLTSLYTVSLRKSNAMLLMVKAKVSEILVCIQSGASGLFLMTCHPCGIHSGDQELQSGKEQRHLRRFSMFASR